MQAPQQEPGIAKRPRETADSDNPAAVKRNRRMFAGLLGTLNQFKWAHSVVLHQPVQPLMGVDGHSVPAAVSVCAGVPCHAGALDTACTVRKENPLWGLLAVCRPIHSIHSPGMLSLDTRLYSMCLQTVGRRTRSSARAG